MFMVALRLIYCISCDQVGRALIVASSAAVCSTVLEMIVAKAKPALPSAKRSSDSDSGGPPAPMPPAPVPPAPPGLAALPPDESTMLMALAINLASHKQAAEKMCGGSRGAKLLRRLIRKAISEQSTWLFKVVHNISKYEELCASLEP